MIKITVTRPNGEVLDVLLIDTDYAKAWATHPEDAVAQSVKECLEENFTVTESL